MTRDQLATYVRTLSARANAIRTATNDTAYTRARQRFEAAMAQIQDAQASASRFGADVRQELDTMWQRTYRTYLDTYTSYVANQLPWQQPSSRTSTSTVQRTMDWATGAETTSTQAPSTPSRPTRQTSRSRQPTVTYEQPTEEEIEAWQPGLLDRLPAPAREVLEVLYPRDQPLYQRPAVWFAGASLLMISYQVYKRTR